MGIDVGVIGALAGVTSVLGLLSIIAYFVFLMQARAAERSVRDLVGNDPLFDANQVVEVLKQFTTDETRLKALETISQHKTRESKDLLSKIKKNVDVSRLEGKRLSHRKQIFSTAGAILLLIGAFGVTYSLHERPSITSGNEDSNESEPPSNEKPKEPVLAGSRILLARESTASAVIATFADVPSWRRTTIFNDHFKDRWIDGSGWTARVAELPERKGRGCEVLVLEQPSLTRILLTESAQGCDLRIGDEIRLVGRITKVDVDMVTVADVTLGGASSPIEPRKASSARKASWARAGTIHAPGAMKWGDWSELAWCEQGKFAIGFRVKIEPKQGDGQSDDTAMNAVELLCGEPSVEGPFEAVSAAQGQFGAWTEVARCASGSALASYTLRSEPDAENDDTAANGIRFGCRSLESSEAATAATLMVSKEGFWGSFGQEAHCPARSAICALKTRVQPYQGKNVSGGHDDTALNDVQFECCSF